MPSKPVHVTRTVDRRYVVTFANKTKLWLGVEEGRVLFLLNRENCDYALPRKEIRHLRHNRSAAGRAALCRAIRKLNTLGLIEADRRKLKLTLWGRRLWQWILEQEQNARFGEESALTNRMEC